MTSGDAAWVVVPAYNEGRVITRVLSGLCRLPYGIVVVDDASTDDTARRVADFPVVQLRHACNLGQGAALRTGMSYALSNPATRYIATFDADGQHDPDDVPRLIEPLRLGLCEVSLGSRFAAGGAALNIPRFRRSLLRAAVVAARLATGLQLTDTHNGLRAFTAEAARRIRISRDRMAHASEILFQIAELGLSYREVPVTVSYTGYSLAKGQSLLSCINLAWYTAMEKRR